MSSHLQIYMISQVSERKASTDGVRKASSKASNHITDCKYQNDILYHFWFPRNSAK